MSGLNTPPKGPTTPPKGPISDVQIETYRGSLLREAYDLITGPRNASYGPPDQDFTRTAAMMTAAFGHKLKQGEKFHGYDVAKVMILLKISRLCWDPTNEDSWKDIAGYAGCGWETVVLEDRQLEIPNE